MTAVLLGLPTTAHAQVAARVQVAWWTSAKAGMATVQEGGSQVAATSDGPVSIAALRLAVPAGATVDYTVAIDSSTLYVSVTACPATSAWAPTSGGDLADAPTWDCDLADAYGQQAANTMSWQFGPAFTKSGVVDVVLVPISPRQSWLYPPSQSNRAWSLTMAPPAEGSVRITSAPGASTGPPTAIAATDEASTPEPAVSGSKRLGPSPTPTFTEPTTASPGTTEVTAPVSNRGGNSSAGRGIAGLALVLVLTAAARVAVARGKMGIPFLANRASGLDAGRSRRGEEEASSDI